MNIRKIIYLLFSAINRVVPKKNYILIYGGKSLDDNSEAMFRYLVDNTNYKICCLADKTMNYQLRKDVKIEKCTYLRTIFSMMSCKVMIDSSYHTIKMRPTKKQLFINCWHGSPLKNMIPDKSLKNAEYYSRLFYAADIFKAHMQKYFSAEENKMTLAGSPRNDYLFENVKLPDSINYSGKKVIWMPTFRSGIGRVESDIDIPVLTKRNMLDLEKILQTENVHLYIKVHRLQAKGFEDLLDEINSDNISLVSDDILMRNNIPLYRFISQMDALLTDYSSIYYDYLLINRPIGFVIDDIEQYKKNRGFAFENPLDYMPGQKIYNMDSLIDFIKSISNNIDKFETERVQANKKFNYYRDACNSERCSKMFDVYFRKV